MKKVVSLIMLVTALVACADFNRDELLQQVQKQQKVLDGLNEKLAASVIKDVAALKNNTMQTELRIKQNLHLDTINFALAKKLEAYKLMRKSIKPLMQQYLKARTGIKEEKAVLKNLSRDIQEGRGERQRYPNFIQFEKQKVKQLQALTDDFLRARTQFFSDYHRLYPEVAAFSRSLIQKQRH